MILGLTTLLSALIISGISAYFSIVGLTAIFAAAKIPIIIMGASLELGKVSTVVWLHYNWDRADWKIKTYLTSAVIVLMFITSMGIFGFLSKSHADQAVPSGDIQAQVQLLDEKIKTQRDNIESSKKALTQLDESVDQLLARSKTENGATRANALRKSQAKERATLQKDIEEAQAVITQLQTERAPIASQLRQAVAEVGPIKYIAAVIYGENTDENLLEAAVRWVIMIIVSVFDPLAIVLILAATTSMDWSKFDRRKRKHDKIEEAKADAIDAAALVEVTSHLPHADLVHKDEVSRLIAEAEALAIAKTAAEYEHKLLEECNLCAEKSSENLAFVNNELEEKTASQMQLESELHAVSQYVTEVVDQVHDLTGMLHTMEGTVTDTLRREESLKQDLATIVSEYDSLLDTKTKLDDTLSATRNELYRLQNVADQLVEVNAIVKAKEEEIAALRSELDTVTNQPIDNSAIIQPLIEELERAKQRQRLLEEELKKSETTAQLLAVEVDNTQQSLSFAQADIERLTIEIDALRNEIASYKDKDATIAEFASSQQSLEPEFASILNANRWDLYETEPEPEVISNIEPIIEQEPEIAVITEEQPVVEEFEVTVNEAQQEITDAPQEPVEEVQLDVDEANTSIVLPEPIVFDGDHHSTVVARKVADRSHGVNAEIHIPEKGEIVLDLPDVPDVLPKGSNASFGTAFPPNPDKGDMFLRVDYTPSRLFKWDDSKWISINKDNVDIYSYDEEYIKLLIHKVSTGEYDADDLSDTEQEQVSEYLRTHPI